MKHDIAHIATGKPPISELRKAASIALLALGSASAGHAQIVRLSQYAVPKQIAYDLTVTRSDTSTPLEFTPVTVRFTLAVKIIGVAGNAPQPTPVRVCAKVARPETTCTTLALPIPGHSYTGSVVAMTSFAGAQSPVRLVVLAPPTAGEEYGGHVVEEGEVRFPVAARYDVGITGFEVVTSRSNQTDTQWLLLQAMIKSPNEHPSAGPDACSLAGFNWCIPPHKLGDHGDGIHAVNDVRVGSYDLVPERETDLRFLFYLDNIGEDPKPEIAAAVANGFSTVGKLILGAYSAQQGSSQGSSFATELDGVMQKMHNAATASCDGKLASGIVVFTNQTLANRPDLTLEGLTRATGAYAATLPSAVDAYKEKDGDFICDRRGSHYRVTYTVFRVSWQPWATNVSW